VNQDNNRLGDAREQLRRLGLLRSVREVPLEAWVLMIVVVLALLISYSIVNRKTLWEWLDLLATPFAIGIVAVIFTAWFTNQRAQDTALQAYLDKMSELLIDRRLRRAWDEYDDKRITARARTLALLAQLNGDRKRTVLQFLREARLINKKEYFGIPAHIVGLRDADLSNANLRGMRLISSKGEAISLEGPSCKMPTYGMPP
jgi:energy-coupling factor transporter transmembrane protein EcfT